jgi:hypothetical protein
MAQSFVKVFDKYFKRQLFGIFLRMNPIKNKCTLMYALEIDNIYFYYILPVNIRTPRTVKSLNKGKSVNVLHLEEI